MHEEPNRSTCESGDAGALPEEEREKHEMIVIDPDCVDKSNCEPKDRNEAKTRSDKDQSSFTQGKDSPTSPSVHTFSIASAKRLLTATYCLKEALSKKSLVLGASGTA
jgi:hypothetical protein